MARAKTGKCEFQNNGLINLLHVELCECKGAIISSLLNWERDCVLYLKKNWSKLRPGWYSSFFQRVDEHYLCLTKFKSFRVDLAYFLECILAQKELRPIIPLHTINVQITRWPLIFIYFEKRKQVIPSKSVFIFYSVWFSSRLNVMHKHSSSCYEIC